MWRSVISALVVVAVSACAAEYSSTEGEVRCRADGEISVVYKIVIGKAWAWCDEGAKPVEHQLLVDLLHEQDGEWTSRAAEQSDVIPGHNNWWGDGASLAVRAKCRVGTWNLRVATVFTDAAGESYEREPIDESRGVRSCQPKPKSTGK